MSLKMSVVVYTNIIHDVIEAQSTKNFVEVLDFVALCMVDS